MKKPLLTAIAALIATGTLVASFSEASAYVAVRRGATVVRPRGVAVVHPRVVAPRRTVIVR